MIGAEGILFLVNARNHPTLQAVRPVVVRQEILDGSTKDRKEKLFPYQEGLLPTAEERRMLPSTASVGRLLEYTCN